MTLRNFSARYHRNGICGAGFYACQWDDAETKQTMTAVVFADHIQANGVPSRYAILSGNIRETWRGDHFIDRVWQAINELGDEVYQ